MKPTSQIIIFILAILTSMASAQAQSPREELKQMVEQLQKTPTDNALREKIIKLAQEVKPAPAVPEEAQRREGRAKFAFKSAKSNDDYLSSAREYEEAVRVAPWIPGYYSDLCTIYEKAEKYVEAKRHCEFSLIGLTDPSQVNEIKQRIAGLEFGIEKVVVEKQRAAREAASAQSAADAKARAAEERRKNSIEGYWFGSNNSQEDTKPSFWIERVGESLVLRNAPEANIIMRDFFDVQVTETSVRMKLLFPGSTAVIQVVLNLRDGYLVGTNTNLGMEAKGSSNATRAARYIRKPWPAN